jgi:dipeptidyl aminopeptidase/acylaminoacyl peptidase
MGHSYGGYCVLALLVQTKRFHAAFSHSGGGFNMSSEYGFLDGNGGSQAGWCEGDQARLNGTLWEKRDAYIENSPLFYLDRVTTPLLLVVGTNDTTNTAQAGEVFNGLRRLGKRVELRLYQNESHCTDGWSQSNTRDVCESMIAWFDTFLKSARK